jgi:hypothetical protein
MMINGKVVLLAILWILNMENSNLSIEVSIVMGLTLGNRTPRDHWCRLEIARLRKKQFYPAQKKTH